MNKLLKIVVPVLVAVMLLVYGVGFAMAQGWDNSAPIQSLAYNQNGEQCPQFCAGNCNDDGSCPYAGNCKSTCQGIQYNNCCIGKSSSYNGNSVQRGNCCGLGSYYNNNTDGQLPFDGCCR